ncbi:MAG: pyridoxal phosphate-dependent aminotransferase [Spirochaetales bacterium]|nr:pyridoxal phosphate-dependent aminotransferase [Spirochaetales bacterium]
MAVATHVRTMLSGSSVIRRLFTEGEEMKRIHGADRVYDFSLGNPDVDPPPAFIETLHAILDERIPNKHGYMASAGLAETRQAIALGIAPEYGVQVPPELVTMTVGAGSALSLAFAVTVNPGDRVLVNAPAFVSYANYLSVHRGTLEMIPGLADFSLNLDEFEQRLGPDVAAVIVNSPNNPSGAIYSKESLVRLAALLDSASERFGRRIYLISDEPYREIVYDDLGVPSPFSCYRHTILVYSWSKSLSVPGERIGYAAIHPAAEDAELLARGMTAMTQNMGYTNAPALMQRAVARLGKASVDVEAYRRRRDMLAAGLKAAGYEFDLPRGAFYLFPKAPGGDDVAFCQALKDERILAVPGSGFGMPGWFRLSYCASESTINGSLPGFARAIQRVLNHSS